MNNNIIKFLILTVFVCFIGDARAKSCWADFHVESHDNSIAFLRSLTDVEFVGVVEGKWLETFENQKSDPIIIKEKTVFSVESVKDGNFSEGDTVIVLGGIGDCLCVRGFEVGKKYSIFADDGDDFLEIRYCSFINQLENDA